MGVLVRVGTLVCSTYADMLSDNVQQGLDGVAFVAGVAGSADRVVGRWRCPFIFT